MLSSGRRGKGDRKMQKISATEESSHGIPGAQASASERPELPSVFLLPRWEQSITSLSHSSLIFELET